MRIVSFGDLYVDYYLKSGELIGLSGGKSNANIIANLSSSFKTAFLGFAGSDLKGDIAIESLKKLGVDVKVIRVDGETKVFFYDNGEYSKECPYCHRRVGYHGSKVDVDFVLDNILPDDVLILDNTNETTLKVLKRVNNKAFIDIGYLGNLLYASLEEIENNLGNRFEIINMNERVYNVLKRKFAIDSQDLYALLKPKILIITRGKRGCDIIIKDEFIKKGIEDPAKEVDASGAGDAFFSEFIRTFLEEGMVDEKMISKAYMRASLKSRLVVSHLGARTHIYPLFKSSDYKECICKDIYLENN